MVGFFFKFYRSLGGDDTFFYDHSTKKPHWPFYDCVFANEKDSIQFGGESIFLSTMVIGEFPRVNFD